jgi:colanic acid/amylovoran biosynthesis glycosyltransferase
MRVSTKTSYVALQRCDQFVGRTTNWLYDHLRFVRGYTPIVLSDALYNRDEFRLLEARRFNHRDITHRIWRRIFKKPLSLGDWWWLRRFSPYIFHSHFGYVAVNDLALQQVLNLPWIVSFYGADVYQLGRLVEWQQAYIQVFNEAVRVLALGPAMKVHLEDLGCPADKIIVHPLGVDIAELPWKPRVLRQGEPLRILFAGTFREKKGIPYLLEAVSLTRRCGLRVELYLVGDGGLKRGDYETKKAVFRLISRLGLENAVVHFPFLSFRELIDLALRSHVFVAPSVTAMDGDAEGTPFVLQQMMATGMAVIATAHSDIPYLFGEYKCLLVPERDSIAIAERLQHYIADPDALEKDGMILRDQIRRAFDVRDCAARLTELYDMIRKE